MSVFNVSIINPVTGLSDASTSNGILTIVDHSNYDEVTPEAGHARSDFSDFYKLKIVLPTDVEYLYSSVGDGDEDIITPSEGAAGDPHVHYTYPAGDGVYWLIIYTVPTYNAGVSYLFSTAPYVWYNSKFWQCLQNSTGQTPAEGAYWHEITDIDDLTTKYRLAERIVIYAEAKRTYARRVYNANVLNKKIGENWEKLLKDADFIDAMRLFLAINAIPIEMAADDWTGVSTSVNFTKDVASKYEI